MEFVTVTSAEKAVLACGSAAGSVQLGCVQVNLDPHLPWLATAVFGVLVCPMTTPSLYQSTESGSQVSLTSTV